MNFSLLYCLSVSEHERGGLDDICSHCISMAALGARDVSFVPDEQPNALYHG